jgi:hypothetical protein
MTKRKLKARVKYLRALYADLDKLSIETTDGIAKARYRKAADYARVTVTFMLDAWEMSNE